jgi:sucrose-6-phosphate hydrolase SacC (GH32 family)
VIQIGWTREFPIPGMPFNQAFSLPTELTLRTTPDGLRLFAYPIKELEQLRRPEPKVLAGRKLTAAEPSAEVESGELTVESLAVHTMKSIWKPNHP